MKEVPAICHPDHAETLRNLDLLLMSNSKIKGFFFATVHTYCVCCICTHVKMYEYFRGDLCLHTEDHGVSLT